MDLQEQLNHWLNILTGNLCHRQLLVVSGPENWAIDQTAKILADCRFDSFLWVGNGGNNNTTIEPKAYREFLGQEFSALTYNCYSGFRANAVMALSGTIKAGGVMVLICPDFDSWANYPDPEDKQRISFGYRTDHQESNFINHLLGQIKLDTSVSILTPEKLTGLPATLRTNYSSAQINCQSENQTQAIEGIVRTALGHRHRPFVLSADRGRGKSSALGIAAASLIKNCNKKIILTAPNFKTVEQVFKHACKLLPEVDLHKQGLTLEHGSLQFMPPDALFAHSPAADLVMVDEAAAIPTPVLKKILSRYPRVVFSTTLHGYEGSGRGFELRFKKHLNLVCPEWKSIHLTQPIRWYPEDVLERFWFRCMLMIKQPDERIMSLTRSTFNTIELNAEQLSKDNTMLHKIFQLLVNAHYQTSPDDLVRLLDAPEQRLFVLKQQDNLLAIALIAEEGGEKLNLLSERIACGSRRVNGHLVPQYMAFHCAEPSFCHFKQWRIVRIVVAPELQGQALGTLLLNEIEKIARNREIEFLSSAFGATKQLLNFWQKNQFSVVKLGFKRDASSGEHSAVVLKALTIAADNVTTGMVTMFQHDLQYHASRHFKHLDTDILIALLKYQGSDGLLKVNETQLVVQFIENRRPLHSCEQVLNKLLGHCLFRFQQELTEDYLFLVSLLVQYKNENVICSEFSLSGKKQIQNRARQAIKKMYQSGLSSSN